METVTAESYRRPYTQTHNHSLSEVAKLFRDLSFYL
jgi:hypothetical protein